MICPVLGIMIENIHTFKGLRILYIIVGFLRGANPHPAGALDRYRTLIKTWAVIVLLQGTVAAYIVFYTI